MNAMALGLIEVVGLPAAIAAADEAVKAANVHLIGYEKTKGGGLIVVKLRGEIGAVKAAVMAGVMAAERVGKVFAHHVIARPANGIDELASQVDRGPAAEPVPPALAPDDVSEAPVRDDYYGSSSRSSEGNEPASSSARSTQEAWQPPDAPNIPLNLAPNDHQPSGELAAGTAMAVLTLEADEAYEETETLQAAEEEAVLEAAPDAVIEEVEVEDASETALEEASLEAEVEAIVEVEQPEEVEFQADLEKTADIESEVCNLCGDPLCTRRKGQPHKRCIYR
jgi:ethanolamine utilization protein EutM